MIPRVPLTALTPRFKTVFQSIVRNPVVWVTAAAYACTGAVRQAVDQWFPRYMQDLYHVDLNSQSFQFLAFMIPLVASIGSLSSGYISDTVFKGRRAPVAAGLYFLETAMILLAAQFHTANAAILFFLLIAFTANSTHSILGAAAPMDIGGRRMAGFALGLIDSFQYFGGSLAGWILGNILDKNMGHYFYFMAPFGVVGGLLMLTILGKVTGQPGQIRPLAYGSQNQIRHHRWRWLPVRLHERRQHLSFELGRAWVLLTG